MGGSIRRIPRSRGLRERCTSLSLLFLFYSCYDGTFFDQWPYVCKPPIELYRCREIVKAEKFPDVLGYDVGRVNQSPRERSHDEWTAHFGKGCAEPHDCDPCEELVFSFQEDLLVVELGT